MSLTALVPLPYRLLAVAALTLALLGFGWLKGAQHEQAKYELAAERAVVQAANLAGRRAAITARVDARYAPAIERVRLVTQTIEREVPTYVSANDCPLSPGFRVLHDAAAAGQLPDASRIADAAAVPAPVVADTVAGNYGTCLETTQRLTALQEWIKAQAAEKP